LSSGSLDSKLPTRSNELQAEDRGATRFHGDRTAVEGARIAADVSLPPGLGGIFDARVVERELGASVGFEREHGVGLHQAAHGKLELLACGERGGKSNAIGKLRLHRRIAEQRDAARAQRAPRVATDLHGRPPRAVVVSGLRPVAILHARVYAIHDLRPIHLCGAIARLIAPLPRLVAFQNHAPIHLEPQCEAGRVFHHAGVISLPHAVLDRLHVARIAHHDDGNGVRSNAQRARDLHGIILRPARFKPIRPTMHGLAIDPEDVARIGEEVQLCRARHRTESERLAICDERRTRFTRHLLRRGDEGALKLSPERIGYRRQRRLHWFGGTDGDKSEKGRDGDDEGSTFHHALASPPSVTGFVRTQSPAKGPGLRDACDYPRAGLSTRGYSNVNKNAAGAQESPATKDERCYQQAAPTGLARGWP